MKRFDLSLLPCCGAKTRSGEPCKRYGSLRNGRCKLHGGRSTGAKGAAVIEPYPKSLVTTD
ncbi:HGGxSTG domain-containing protein [Ferrimonas senticii]|uniref:HGGxSTG domain-containing protein n=1 Tax=Ferrimonas senticii TaxID=394566 RepID=UPI0009FBDA88|nr:HGGxSTG domain-containing protein [Ferrimonas senticii]